MSLSGKLFVAVSALVLAACASRQDITRLEDERIRKVCIVEHSAVMTATLDTIKEGFSRRGFDVRVIKGTYERKHSAWQPHFQVADTVGCDALLFYVANWSWDLAYYMRFANLWMTDASGKRRLAQATYDASGNIGVGKFIVARDKLLELVDQMVAGVPARTVAPAAPVSPPAEAATKSPPAGSDVKGRLQRLEDLRKQGVITEEEYAARRKAILESL